MRGKKVAVAMPRGVPPTEEQPPDHAPGPKKQLTLTAEDVQRQYEQGMLTEAGRDHMLAKLGISVEGRRSASVQSILERFATGDLTAEGARAFLARQGYSDFEVNRYPEYVAHPPTLRRRWWRLTTSDFWAALFEQGAINVIVLESTARWYGDDLLEYTNVKHADGTSLDLESLLRQGELFELNGAFYRYVGTTGSTHAVRSGDRKGHKGKLESRFYAGSIVRAAGKLLTQTNAYGVTNALVGKKYGGFVIDGFDLKFTGRLKGQAVRHVPDALIKLAHSDPDVHRSAEPDETGKLHCRCWFTDFSGIVVEPFLAPQEEANGVADES